MEIVRFNPRWIKHSEATKPHRRWLVCPKFAVSSRGGLHGLLHGVGKPMLLKRLHACNGCAAAARDRELGAN
jgi:hypothetical protein